MRSEAKFRGGSQEIDPVAISIQIRVALMKYLFLTQILHENNAEFMKIIAVYAIRSEMSSSLAGN